MQVQGGQNVCLDTRQCMDGRLNSGQADRPAGNFINQDVQVTAFSVIAMDHGTEHPWIGCVINLDDVANGVGDEESQTSDGFT